MIRRAGAAGARPAVVAVAAALLLSAAATSQARAQGMAARFTRRVPDLEADAVRYLCADYAVDNSKLKASGYRLLYPDFAASMREIGQRFRDGTLA